MCMLLGLKEVRKVLIPMEQVNSSVQFDIVQLSKTCHKGLEYRADTVTPPGIFV